MWSGLRRNGSATLVHLWVVVLVVDLVGRRLAAGALLEVERDRAGLHGLDVHVVVPVVLLRALLVATCRGTWARVTIDRC